MKNTSNKTLLQKGGAALTAPLPAGKAIVLAVILAGFMATLALNLPGQLSYDSVVQLLDGRTGEYHPWHPPVMAWLLGLGDAVLRGTGLFVAVNAALGFFSLGSLLWIKQKITTLTALVALFCVLTPQFLLYQGIVWKDVLFANVTVAGFVCLAHAAQCWPQLRLRLTLLAAAVAFFTLAGLTRQNGAIAVLFGALAVGWIAADHNPALPMKTGLTYGFATLACVILLAALGNWALEKRTTHDSGPAEQIVLLQAYDVIGALAHDPNYRLDILEAQNPILAKRMRSDGIRLYSPLKNDTLEDSTALDQAMSLPASAPGIAAQWRDLAFHNTWLYLRTRAAVFRQLFLPQDASQCVPYYLGVDGPPEEMQQLGLSRRWRPQERFLSNYAANFVGTPVLSHAAFAGLSVLLLTVLLRRRKPADIALGCMLACVLAFALSFFAISIACDYRYVYALDVAALFALFYLA